LRKQIAIEIVLTLVAAILLCSGVASALNSEDASAEVLFSSNTMNPGQNLGLRIVFNVTSPQQVQIKSIGIHFDWMPEVPEVKFAGPNFSSNPATLSSDGTFISDPIFVQIPLNVSVGTHPYIVGVDGVDASGDFSWTSPEQTIQVTYSNLQTPSPTATPNSGGGGQTGGTLNFTTVLIIIAVVAIAVAVAIVILEIRKKPKHAKPVAEKATPPAEQPQKDNYDI
jgi:hypothetical protein